MLTYEDKEICLNIYFEKCEKDKLTPNDPSDNLSTSTCNLYVHHF